MSEKVLMITASPRGETSVSRILAEELTTALGGQVTLRDTGQNMPFVDRAFAGERGVGADLPLSDALIAEVKAHDTLVIATPVYNFGVPASLKAWVDQIARPGITFSYSAAGPEGLLKGKKAYIVIASGGTPVDGPADFATPWLRHVLGFIGITDVEVIAADALGNGADKVLDTARDRIAALTAARAA